VTKLVTELVSVVEFGFGFVVFEHMVLHCIALVYVVGDVAEEQKVEIKPMDSRSS